MYIHTYSYIYIYIYIHTYALKWATHFMPRPFYFIITEHIDKSFLQKKKRKEKKDKSFQTLEEEDNLCFKMSLSKTFDLPIHKFKSHQHISGC